MTECASFQSTLTYMVDTPPEEAEPKPLNIKQLQGWAINPFNAYASKESKFPNSCPEQKQRLHLCVWHREKFIHLIKLQNSKLE